MNCSPNIITANFSGGKTSATTAPLWQWDYGQVLCITGIEDLPAAFEVHFSTNKSGGVSTVAVGADGQVTIPNVLLTIGKSLNAWIYLSDAQGEGETEYAITIPVKARPMPETYDAEATGVFDDVVRQVSEYAETAQTAADNAGASASAAAASADSAAASATAAAGSATAAAQSKADAALASRAASTAAQDAKRSADAAAEDAGEAAISAHAAMTYRDAAEAAATEAKDAKADATTAAGRAESAATAAGNAASGAGQAATAAGQYATSAGEAAGRADTAAQTATTKAADATAAAETAVDAKTAAQTAQQGAETAETNAGQSASTATTKAAEAAQSATDAASAKTAAESAATRAEQAAATLTVDTALSDTSTNPVQNKVITGELTNVKNAICWMLNDAFETERITYSGLTKGYWNISGSAASITELSSGYYYALPAIPVDTGKLYHIYVNAGGAHPDAIIFANHESNAYTVVDKVTISASGDYEYDVLIPSGATHVLITKFGTKQPTVDKYLVKVDDTLTAEGVPADAKSVGDRLSVVEDAVSAMESDVAEIPALTSKVNAVESAVIDYAVKQTSPVEYTTSTNANTSFYAFPFKQGVRYKVHVEFSASGTPYPTSQGFALTMYTLTAQQTTSIYRVDTVAQQADFAAVDSVFTASGNASYISLYTRSKGSGVYFNGTITISEVETIRDDIDYLHDYNAVSMYTASDDVTAQASYSAVLALYDALVTEYPDYVSKNPLNDSSVGEVIYEYIFSTGKYNAVAGHRTSYTAYDKPKVLITTGVHGDEKGAISSAYTVMKALCSDPRLRRLKEQVDFHIVPVVNIYGVNNDSRLDENGVNINRNFDARWSSTTGDAGSTAASEYATQVIQDWMDDNSDALFYLDYHNSGYNNELAYFGVDVEETNENANILCRHFWDGITRVFAYWENVRKLDRSSLIFGYVGKVPFTGTTVAYACEKAGIPSALLETQVRMPSDGTGNKYSATVIGVAAESLANILLGMYDYLNGNVNAVS